MSSDDEVRAAQIQAAKASLQVSKGFAGCYGLGVGCFAIVTGSIALVVCLVCLWLLFGLAFSK